MGLSKIKVYFNYDELGSCLRQLVKFGEMFLVLVGDEKCSSYEM